MALPTNVATCTVTGTFVKADGSIPGGIVEFIPSPPRLADVGATVPATILSGPITANVDSTGAISVVLPATDDADLNPSAWTYQVHVRVDGSHYSFDMEAPSGTTLDLTAVTPVDATDGVLTIQGPPGADGVIGADGEQGEPGIVVSDSAPDDTTLLWADTGTEGVGPSQTVSVFTYTDETDERPDATVVFWIPDPYTLANPVGAEVGDLVLRTTPDVITSVTGVTNVEHYTVTEYDAIVTPDPDTVYIVVADP